MPVEDGQTIRTKGVIRQFDSLGDFIRFPVIGIDERKFPQDFGCCLLPLLRHVMRNDRGKHVVELVGDSFRTSFSFNYKYLRGCSLFCGPCVAYKLASPPNFTCEDDEGGLAPPHKRPRVCSHTMQDNVITRGASNTSTGSDSSSGVAAATHAGTCVASSSVHQDMIETGNHSPAAANSSPVAGSCTGGMMEQNGQSYYSSSMVMVKRTTKKLDAHQRTTLRLIQQYLRDLGLPASVDTLSQESGCELEIAVAAQFRNNVLNGRWDMIEHDLKQLKNHIANDEHLKEMKFLLLEQMYLELVEAKEHIAALSVLRDKLSPLKYNTERLHRLSSFLMCADEVELRREAGWNGVGIESRQILLDRLQEFLPNTVMLPPRRLNQLLFQAVQKQICDCPFHGGDIDATEIVSDCLLGDHLCDIESLPSKSYQVLSDHMDEVWMCQFSHSGCMLATASKSCMVIVYRMDPETFRFTREHVFDKPYGISCGSSFLAWSPDDSMIAVAGSEEAGSEIFIWSVREGRLLHRFHKTIDDNFTTIAWFDDNKRFACGSTKGQFYCCEITSSCIQLLHQWEGVRVRSLYCKRNCDITNQNDVILASDTHNRLRSYALDGVDKSIIREEHQLINFIVDKSERYALLTVAQQGLHLWDLENASLVRRYRGSVMKRFTLHPTFGGHNQHFIACGSEDNQVVVWHRDREQPISYLEGHGGVVNSASWNSVYPTILASASDDGTVRIWGPASYQSQVSTPAEMSSLSNSNGVDLLTPNQVASSLMRNHPDALGERLPRSFYGGDHH